MAKDDPVELSCLYVHHTPMAVRLDFGLDEDVWVPRSLISDHDGDENLKGASVVEVPEWFAFNEGLI